MLRSLHRQRPILFGDARKLSLSDGPVFRVYYTPISIGELLRGIIILRHIQKRTPGNWRRGHGFPRACPEPKTRTAQLHPGINDATARLHSTPESLAARYGAIDRATRGLEKIVEADRGFDLWRTQEESTGRVSPALTLAIHAITASGPSKPCRLGRLSGAWISSSRRKIPEWGTPGDMEIWLGTP
jgi:hypothetical protein